MNRILLALVCLAPAFAASTTAQVAMGAPSHDGIEAEEDAPPPEPTELQKRARAAREVVGVFRLRSDQIHEWLRESRRARQAKRAACLDDALSQSHALERQGDQAQNRAERAADEDDAATVQRELVRIQVYDGLSQQVLGTAQQCGLVRRAHRR